MADRQSAGDERLKRERAGRYLTPDGRFAVESESASTWYLVDQERQDQLGLPMVRGPFATLDAARDAIAAARAEPVGEMPAPPAPPSRRGGRDAAEPEPAPAPEPEPEPEQDAKPAGRASHPDRAERIAPPEPRGRATSAPPERPAAREPAEPEEPPWIARLPPARQAEARRLLGILERLGIDDPAIARRELEADLPGVAAARLAQRLASAVLERWTAGDDALDGLGQPLARRIRPHARARLDPAAVSVKRVRAAKLDPDDVAGVGWLAAVQALVDVLDVLEDEGRGPGSRGMPGWRLVEIDERGKLTGRTIVVDPTDLIER